jgi:hypothetical protein
MVPYDDPALFNATVDRFFREPFAKEGSRQRLFQIVPGDANGHSSEQPVNSGQLVWRSSSAISTQSKRRL